MKGLSFLIFLVAFLNSCNSTSQVRVESSIWSPKVGYEKKEYDSVMTLVFEENFDDSIQLYRGSEHIKELYIKTNKTVGVVPLFHKIKKLPPKINEILKIHFIEKDETIEIELGKEFSYTYISRTKKGEYFVEYSNFERKYY